MNPNRIQQIREAALRAASDRRGMSLVEVVVVIAIILTLMSLIGYGIMQTFGETQVDTTKLSMSQVADKVQIYQVRKGKVPASGEGLRAVYTDIAPPKDAWGNEFVYVSPGPNGQPFDIISLGADGREGGSGNNADIKLSETR
jgi:general secretion pathway protein G